MKKLVFVGDCGVGKTTIIRRYILGISPKLDSESYPTIGAAYYEVPKYSTTKKVAIWDTAGQERFKTIAPIYYRGSQGCICVFDVSLRSSFDSCEEWIKLFHTNCMHVNPFILLIGNKCDLPIEGRKVKDSEIGVLCNLYGCQYIETDCVNVINSLIFDEILTKFASQTHELVEGLELDGNLNERKVENSKCSKGCY